jgi:enoyl-CoA hydratase/carnithine racemase
MTRAKDLVLTSTEGGVTTVTMNRPEALNALSAGLRNRLTEVFTDLAEDSATEVIVFTGNGRAFTVGLDLKELGGETAAATVVNKDLGKAMLQVNKPIIGAINGYAITGGFELALMCDFMLASEQAKFADTHAGRCCTRMGTISAPTETNRHQPRKRAKPYRQLFGCSHGLHMGFGESRGGRRRTFGHCTATG